MGLTRKVRVLIVDDSAVVRQILSRELAKDREIEVVGTAGDPFIARNKIISENPDVITLDLEMPRMDGLTFLKKLMAYHPVPVVILSSLAESGTQIAMDALEAGALTVFAKPKCDVEHGLADTMVQLTDAVKAAAGAVLRPRGLPMRTTHTNIRRPSVKSAPLPEPVAAGSKSGLHGSVPHAIINTTDKVIAIGASTGGTEAIKDVLMGLPVDIPGILCVIHMPEGFTQRFAQRLNDSCAIEVREAAQGDRLRPGLALIARGDHHLVLTRSGAHYYAEVRRGPLICRHRPSVEVLFQSVAHAAGPNALGMILTGMGGDGSDGLLAMRKAGAHTLAQDEHSCVVFGMPKEAINKGAAIDVLPLSQMAGACIRWANAVRA